MLTYRHKNYFCTNTILSNILNGIIDVLQFQKQLDELTSCGTLCIQRVTLFFRQRLRYLSSIPRSSLSSRLFSNNMSQLIFVTLIAENVRWTFYHKKASEPFFTKPATYTTNKWGEQATCTCSSTTTLKGKCRYQQDEQRMDTRP